ncbi:MAG: OmpA family protein, partial [Pseudomonadales bacterium]|nr:OmpA family protein [Pseudomonadales bacterium]
IRSIGPGVNWQPYLTAGAGRAEFRYDGLQDKEMDSLFNLGAGFFANLTERLAFRADVRGVNHNGADSFSPMATAGLSFILGGAKPAPMVAAPAPVDSDGDGVTDDRDGCPNTPAGVSVDARGCPLDSDRDGVPDHRDDCPNTPAGAKVDARGCEVVIEKPVSFNLTVEFGFDSAEITGVAFQEMLELLKFLREYPSTSAVIEGHTDSRGAEDYNQNLSQRRAAAVLEALTNSGIPRSRLSSVGYGESRPVASNDTDAGRAKNRRVTVVVSGVARQ